MKKIFALFLLLFVFSYTIQVEAATLLNDGEKVIDIELGGYNSFAITDQGRVFSWGRAEVGMAANTNILNGYQTPVDITSRFGLSEGESVTKIKLGYYHGVAITSTGRLLSWGSGSRAANSTGAQRQIPTAVSISLNADEKFVDIETSGFTTYALTNQNRLFGFGDSESGQLGNNSISQSAIDITSTYAFDVDEAISIIAVGGQHTGLLTSTGKFYTRGENFNGQLGDTTYTGLRTKDEREISQAFTLASGDFISSISLGDNHSLVLTNLGDIYSFGSNESGELARTSSIYNGRPTSVLSSFSLETGDKIVKIEAGYDMSGALTSNGQLFVFGENSFATFPGETNGANVVTPKNITNLVPLLQGEEIVEFDLGGGTDFSGSLLNTHMGIVTSFGRVFMQGSNQFGQLGLGYKNTYVATPSLVSTISPSFDPKITFESNGGSDVTEIQSPTGSVVNEPSAPTRLGYTFGGWFTDDQTFLVPFTFSTMPESDTVLYAKWILDTYSISYELNGGSIQDLSYGELIETYTILTPTITLPVLEKEGYTFEGFYDNENLIGDVITEITLGDSGNIALFAKWTINSYQINVIVSDTETIPFDFDYNEDISTLTLDDRLPEYFRGFYLDALYTQLATLTTMPASDLTLYAHFSSLLSYDMSNVLWIYNGPFTYDGTAFSVSIDETTLPTGVTVKAYTQDSNTDAGTYEATVEFNYDTENYLEPNIQNLTWVINKATFDMSGVTFSHPSKVTYTGSPFEVTMLNLPSGLDVTYDDNIFTDAGIYTFDWSFTFNTNNYEAPVFQDTYTVEVEKALYDLSGIQWTDYSGFIYNGSSQTVKIISGLPSGLFADDYLNASLTNAGTYTATVSFINENTNYVDPEPITFNWSIAKADYVLDNIMWNTSSFVYSNELKRVEIISGLPDGVSVSNYENHEFTEAGSYVATANLQTTDTNYNQPNAVTFNWDILKATYDLSNIVWNITDPVTYSGSIYTAHITSGLPQGVTVTYTNDAYTNAGTYTTTVQFTYDTTNYNLPVLSYTWEIIKATYDMSNVIWVYEGPFTEDGTSKVVTLINLPQGVTAQYQHNNQTLPGVYTATVTFNYDSLNYIEPSFTSLTWEILPVYTVTFNIDGVVTSFTGLAGTTISLPEIPNKEGYVFKGFNQEVPTEIPAQDITLVATYVKYTEPSESQYKVYDFEMAFDLSPFSEDTIELVLEVEFLESGLSQTEENAVLEKVNSLYEKGDYRVVSVLVYAQRENVAKTYLDRAQDYFTVTMNLPRSIDRYNDFKVYEMINNTLVPVTFVYVEGLDELSFDVLNLGNYVIVFDASYQTPWGLIIPLGLALILGLGYGIYKGIGRKRFIFLAGKDDVEEDEDDVEVTVVTKPQKRKKKVIHYKFRK